MTDSHLNAHQVLEQVIPKKKQVFLKILKNLT